MSKTCPACAMEGSESPRRSSPWVPIVTVVGVSAAAILVYRQLTKSKGGLRIDDVVSSCTRAAGDLERRLTDTLAALAG